MDLSGWIAARTPSPLTHFDAAAAGRPSVASLRAQVEHLHREAETGAYVAEAWAEQGVLARGRARLGELVGLAGSDVAFTGSGADAFALLLPSWPLGRGARIGTIPGEYGANAAVLHELARHRGWELVALPVDALGRVTDLVPGLDLVTFPQIASQRGVVQPVAEVLSSGVPLVLDVAQALGQVEVPRGCAAYVGTSRKWLCGPRGVGFIAVDPAWEAGLHDPANLSTRLHDGVRRFEAMEGAIAARTGLAVAVTEWSAEVLPVVQQLSRALRTRLTEDSRWRVVEPVDEPTGITTLVVSDPFALRTRLVERGFLVSAVPTVRAADVPEPLLRVSTPPWLTPDDVDRFVLALASAV